MPTVVTSDSEWIMVEEETCTTPSCTTPLTISRQPSDSSIDDISKISVGVGAVDVAEDNSKKKKKGKSSNKHKAATNVSANADQPPAAAQQQPIQSRKARLQALKQAKATQVRLWDAAKCGSASGVQRSIAGGADVNAIDSREGGVQDHVPALVHGGSACGLEVIDLLCDGGAELEGCNGYGVTSLMEAASSDRAKAAAATERLLLRGALVNAGDCDGETALWKAAEAGRVGPVKVLLNKGADPQLQDTKGRTAADIAEKNGHTKVVTLLRLVMQDE